MRVVLEEVLDAGVEAISNSGTRKEFYKRIIEAFNDEVDLDVDIAAEILENSSDKKVLKAAMLELHPDWEL